MISPIHKPTLPHVDSTKHFSYLFTEEEIQKMNAIEDKMNKFSRFPILGQICVWVHDFYLENAIDNEEKNYEGVKTTKRMIDLRKQSIRILQNCRKKSVIHAIVMTIIWGLSTYLDTRSPQAAYLAIGYKFSAFYTLMTLPSDALIWHNTRKLDIERAKRNEQEDDMFNKSDDSDKILEETGSQNGDSDIKSL